MKVDINFIKKVYYEGIKYVVCSIKLYYCNICWRYLGQLKPSFRKTIANVLSIHFIFSILISNFWWFFGSLELWRFLDQVKVLKKNISLFGWMSKILHHCVPAFSNLSVFGMKNGYFASFFPASSHENLLNDWFFSKEIHHQSFFEGCHYHYFWLFFLFQNLMYQHLSYFLQK